MGVKWTAKLKVDFEMEDGAPANLAETYSKSSRWENFGAALFRHQDRREEETP